MKRESHKRANALKGILEKQGAKEDAIEATNIDHDNMPNSSFRDAVENLRESLSQKRGLISNPATNYVQSIELFQNLIDQEIGKAAKEIGIEDWQLKAWLDMQIEVPAKTILSFLRTIQSLYLDPLNEEIGFMQHEDGNWQTFISIEGCSKLLNHHKEFNGLVFTQAEALIEGVPEWIECSIYRKDRILPITIREHFVEVKNDNSFWQKMPIRMLRHKALQQCVRLAFSGQQ